MKKVYIITYKTVIDEVFSGGVSYVVETKEKAINLLKKIRQDELNNLPTIESLIANENSFIIEYNDNYIRYDIVEEEII